jgi:cytochrome b
MDDFLNNLKRQASDNPAAALAAGAAVIGAIAKLFGTGIAMRNSRAWAKEVSRRAIKDGLK